MRIFFISKDASWQKYRLEIFSKLGELYNINIEVLTTGKLSMYLKGNTFVKYRIFKSIFPQKWKLSFFPGALLFLIMKKPDVVLCLNNVTQLTEYCAFIICKIIGIRFVWWTHAYDHCKPKSLEILNRLKEKYVLFFLKRADAIITFSRKGKQYLIKKGLKKEEVFHAPNTLDTEKNLRLYRDLVLNKESIKEKLGFKKLDRIVLFSGRLYKEKKVDQAIDIISEAVKKYKNLYLVIIGDGDERRDLEIYANSKCPGHIKFLGSLYDDYELAKWFSITELCLIPGSIGLAIVHAFCFGLPMITQNDVFHRPEIQFLHDTYNGYLCEKGDIKGMAEKVIYLLNNQAILSQMSKNAVKTVEEEANIRLMLKKMYLALRK